jgi:hypothetical protein
MAKSTRILKQGVRDPQVSELRELLQKQGFWNASFSPYDGLTPSLMTAKLTEAVVYFQQTHLDSSGQPLDADGVVGAKTWWSLRHSTGKAQKSNLQKNLYPEGIGIERLELLTTAMKYHGAKETPNGSNRGPVVDKFLPGWSRRSKKGPAWCMFFVSFVTKATFGSYPLGRVHGSCKKGWVAAKARSMTYTAPVPGDAFMMLRANGTGHVGFVYRVSEDGKRINTIEGNCGNRVKIGCRDTKTITAGFIDFVGTPRPRKFERGLVKAQNVGAHGTR